MSEINLALYWQLHSARHAFHPALIYGPDEITNFGELDIWANALAGFLVGQGCVRGDVIAIGHEKTPFAYAAMLACLKLGLPYLILDSASPGERLARIISIALPKLLLYDDEKYAQKLTALPCPVQHLSPEFVMALPEFDPEPYSEAIDGQTIAYIMFTSGSTGNPKGVAVPHGNVLRFITWAGDRFHLCYRKILAQASPMYFDNSVMDFYGGLFNGAALVPISRKLLNSPYELVTHVASCSCTFWFSVPSLLIYLMTMKALSQDRWPKIKYIAFGGEGYPKPELKKLFDLFGKQATLANVYGPTECTCICSAHDLKASDFENLDGLPTLGRLNPDFDFIIDNPDENGIGELVLMGPQVAAGYYNDSERTAAAFGVCEELGRYRKQYYRTGDLVSVRDGLFYFHGRKDNQIKHLGYRIELEEIEHAIMNLPGITRAAVIYARQNTAFGKIMAYASCKSQADGRQLLRELGKYLPAYMIPSKLTIMAELPKNANGKVDKRVLQALAEKQSA